MLELVQKIAIEALAAGALLVVVVFGLRWLAVFLAAERDHRKESAEAQGKLLCKLGEDCHEAHEKQTTVIVGALDRSTEAATVSSEALGQSREAVGEAMRDLRSQREEREIQRRSGS